MVNNKSILQTLIRIASKLDATNNAKTSDLITQSLKYIESSLSNPKTAKYADNGQMAEDLMMAIVERLPKNIKQSVSQNEPSIRLAEERTIEDEARDLLKEYSLPEATAIFKQKHNKDIPVVSTEQISPEEISNLGISEKEHPKKRMEKIKNKYPNLSQDEIYKLYDKAIEAPVEEELENPETKPVTKRKTKPVTKPIVEPSTEPIVEPSTEPIVEPSTEPNTEPIVEPVVTEPVVKAPAKRKIKPTEQTIVPNIQPSQSQINAFKKDVEVFRLEGATNKFKQNFPNVEIPIVASGQISPEQFSNDIAESKTDDPLKIREYIENKYPYISEEELEKAYVHYLEVSDKNPENGKEPEQRVENTTPIQGELPLGEQTPDIQPGGTVTDPVQTELAPDSTQESLPGAIVDSVPSAPGIETYEPKLRNARKRRYEAKVIQDGKLAADAWFHAEYPDHNLPKLGAKFKNLVNNPLEESSIVDPVPENTIEPSLDSAIDSVPSTQNVVLKKPRKTPTIKYEDAVKTVGKPAADAWFRDNYKGHPIPKPKPEYYVTTEAPKESVMPEQNVTTEPIEESYAPIEQESEYQEPGINNTEEQPNENIPLDIPYSQPAPSAPPQSASIEQPAYAPRQRQPVKIEATPWQISRLKQLHDKHGAKNEDYLRYIWSQGFPYVRFPEEDYQSWKQQKPNILQKLQGVFK